MSTAILLSTVPHEMVKLLQLLLTSGSFIKAIDSDQNTPLHLAVWKGHTNAVELLLDTGASIQAINKYHNTTLHFAAWNGHTGMVELLFRNGAPIEASWGLLVLRLCLN